jgi:polysaccharide pyruvyl transferase WcaK-like protein
MKIGIFTYHYIPNYGARLQASYLTQFLRNSGHDAEIVDYIPVKNVARWLRGAISNALRLRFFRYLRDARIQNREFDNFLRGPALLSRERTYFRAKAARMAQNYDLLITGSDEVWNMRNWRGWNSIYFLDFGGTVACRRISYAASAGSFQPSEDELTRISKYLRSYVACFVRDERTANLVSAAGATPQRVLDPVFLIPSVATSAAAIGPYMALSGVMNAQQVAAAIRLARRNGLRVVGVGYAYAEAEENRSAIGPLEWVNLISKATVVVTTLFHACAFAIKANRPFFVYTGESKRVKLQNLMDGFDLTGRIIANAMDLDLAKIEPLPSETPAKVECLAEQSRRLLLSTISLVKADLERL